MKQYRSSTVPDYLLRYAARSMHTTARRLIPDQPDMDRILQSSSDFSDDSWFSGMRSCIAERMRGKKRCHVFSLEKKIFYTCIPDEEGLAVLGPVRFPAPVVSRDNCSLYAIGMAAAETHYEEWLQSLPVIGTDTFIECSLLLIHSLHPDKNEDCADREAFIEGNFLSGSIHEDIQTRLSRMIFENRENNFIHNTYNHELRECVAVEQGNVEELNRTLEENFAGRYGSLSDDPLRQEIDMGIIIVTLSSRAAIRGGLSYETAFTMSDNFIHLLEETKDVIMAQHIARQAELQYCTLVHEQNTLNRTEDKAPENKHISHCKDYIYTHLHSKLTVQKIAAELGLEPNYLSALFRRYEKVPLKQYIILAKIQLVKNLLTYSSYSCSEIATYLCFTSQSHMGEQFRKVTGMTPRQYREKYHRDDFLQTSS